MTRTHATAQVPIFLLIITLLLSPLTQAAGTLELVHIHGLSFDPQGQQLLIPAHYGIAVYQGGHWHKAKGPDHDYMGFSVSQKAFYTSGHPAPGSSLLNPFGLKKSTDHGGSWRELGMQGEADFHVMASSYNSNAIYVLNMQANRRMPLRGLYYTLNDGNQWHHVNGQGAPEPNSLAVHPDSSGIVAVTSREGLFLSTDYGQHFKVLDDSLEVYTADFDFDGRHLYYAGYDIAPRLSRVDFTTGERTAISLPPLGRDAVAFIAQNPVNLQQLAIATFNRDVYLSDDGGVSWRQIARQGSTL